MDVDCYVSAAYNLGQTQVDLEDCETNHPTANMQSVVRWRGLQPNQLHGEHENVWTTDGTVLKAYAT